MKEVSKLRTEYFDLTRKETKKVIARHWWILAAEEVHMPVFNQVSNQGSRTINHKLREIS